MSSREDFMRSLGISMDDVTDPSAVKTRHPTKVSVSSRPTMAEEEEEQPERPSPRGVPAAAQPSGRSSTINSSSSSKRDFSTPVVVQQRSANASPVYSMEKENAFMPTKYQQQQHQQQQQQQQAPSKMMAAPSDSSAAREQFLRSLGIDNMDRPNVTAGGAAPASNTSPPKVQPSRASQEYLKSKVAAAAASSHDDDDDYTPSGSNGHTHNTSTSSSSYSSFRPQQQPDLTLGHRRSSSRNANGSSSSMSGDPAYPAASSSSFMPGGGSGGAISSEHDQWTVDQLKNEGNKAFEEGDFRKAIRLYTKGIDRDPANAALYSNRSASYLQAAKQMGIDTRAMALRDADKVIDLRPDWFKGYSRRGDALFKCERYSEAAVAYERALALDSDNTNLMHSLGEARNAAGNISSASTQRAAAAWSTAPTALESLSAKKSSHELLEEMKRNIQKESKECILVGNDFRDAELQRFRELKSKSQPTKATNPSSSSAQKFPDPTQPQLKREMISEEFSSDAAAAYQKNLLEQYRAKKAAQQQKDISKYM